MSKVGIIIAREFNERVRKKSFIITTILMPVLMIGLMIVPALIMNYSRGDTKRIAVIDESGLVLPALESDEVLVFEPTQLSVTEARTQLPDAFGVLWIGKDVLGNPSEVKLYANTSSSMLVESGIESQISRILEREKLKAYAIDDLPRILEAVKTPVHLQVFRNDEGGQDRQARSSAISSVVGMVLGFILYMFLLIYGAMVMQSVIEEKNNRVLEVVVSSIRPFQLMMGKILGVASVAVVQVLIWGVLVVAAGALVMPRSGAAGDDAERRGDAVRRVRPRSCNGYGHGYAASRRYGDRPGVYPPNLRLSDALRHRRLPALFSDVRRRRIERGQHPGRTAVADAYYDSDYPVDLRDDGRDERPQFAARILVLDDSFHLPRGDDGPHPGRNPRLGDRRIARAALPVVRRHGLACREDLPRGDLHVREETQPEGDLQVGAVQILITCARSGIC